MHRRQGEREMTSPESFVSRWARLKRGADIHRATEVADDGAQASATETPATGVESAIVQPEIAVAADAPFDPASLPSIDAIGVDTDIRGFLQSRVPAELTKAALRRAWASDPAIRDFIGIAENQWDFNDPNAMPGFGPLPESADIPTLLAQALGQHDKPIEMVSERPVSAEPSRPAVMDHEPADPDQDAQQISDGSPLTHNLPSLPDHSREEGAASGDDRVAAIEDDAPPNHRSHGSALPR
jgi:hypothetical protein